MDKYEALAEILNDEDLSKEVIADSAEETVKNLQARGLDFSVEELKEVASNIDKATKTSGEIDESDLDNVSGGLLRRNNTPWCKPGKIPGVMIIVSPIDRLPPTAKKLLGMLGYK